MEQQPRIEFGARGNAGVAQSSPVASIDRRDVERIVRKFIDERRKRASYFPKKLFSDPAWDILLVMALAEAQHQRLCVTRLCDRLDVPATTALRWINTLTDEGLLIRREDVNDKRRKYVELSSQAYATMTAYCSTTGAEFARAA